MYYLHKSSISQNKGEKITGPYGECPSLWSTRQQLHQQPMPLEREAPVTSLNESQPRLGHLDDLVRVTAE